MIACHGPRETNLSSTLFRALVSVSLLLLSAGPSQAEEATALPAGWTFHEDAGSVMDVVALSCGPEQAFMRSWHGRVAQFHGGQWTAVPAPSGSAYGRKLWAAPDGIVFTLASGRIAEWNGGAWRDHEIPEGPGELGAIWGVSSKRVIVVGRGRVAAMVEGRFRSFDAGTWRDLNAIWGAGPTDIWVGGQGGTILHYDGHRWTRTATNTTEWIHGLWGSSVRDIWGWGDNNTVLHWDGSTWTSRTAGLPGGVDAIGGSSPEQVYAAGDFGLARYRNGRWTVEVSPAMLGEGYHDLVGVCATSRHIIVADAGGHALVRPL